MAIQLTIVAHENPNASQKHSIVQCSPIFRPGHTSRDSHVPISLDDSHFGPLFGRSSSPFPFSLKMPFYPDHSQSESENHCQTAKDRKGNHLNNNTRHGNLFPKLQPWSVHADLPKLTQYPACAMVSEPAVIPPPAAWIWNVMTSLQTNIRTIFRDERKRQSSPSSHFAKRGRMM